MRKITRMMVNAFYKGENLSLSNTTVKNYKMFLFGNKIAWLENNTLYFTLCGWNTPTTRERLNGLGVGISQRNFKPIWNGEEIEKNKIYRMEV